jgi:hypothetical protein
VGVSDFGNPLSGDRGDAVLCHHLQKLEFYEIQLRRGCLLSVGDSGLNLVGLNLNEGIGDSGV